MLYFLPRSDCVVETCFTQGGGDADSFERFYYTIHVLHCFSNAIFVKLKAYFPQNVPRHTVSSHTFKYAVQSATVIFGKFGQLLSLNYFSSMTIIYLSALNVKNYLLGLHQLTLIFSHSSSKSYEG
jgi:hypothetical protein